MGSWKLVLDEAAFQWLLSRSAADRRKLLAVFGELRNNPYRDADYRTKDDTGRELSVLAVRPFLIALWLDAIISEIRIVNIQQIRLLFSHAWRFSVFSAVELHFSG